MDAESVRDCLAKIDWPRQFDQATLGRANAYLRDNHLESLRIDVDRRGITRLRGLVRGSTESIYEPWVEFRPQRRGDISLVGSCDCPVVGSCKHQALIMLYAQRYPANEWPQEARAEAITPPAQRSAADQLDALPAWLRNAMAGQVPVKEGSSINAWDAWFSQLSHLRPAVTETTKEAAGERQFGIILREIDGRLAVLLAFMRPGRGRTSGLVDPKVLELTEDGPIPTPPGGWDESDAMAIGSILSDNDGMTGKADPVVVLSSHIEAALVHLMSRHPVFWEKGTSPLELGPTLPMQLSWLPKNDGTQVLTAVVEGEARALVLHGYGLWYVEPEALRYGRLDADARLMALVQRAPTLQPEDVIEVQHRFKRMSSLPVAMPRPRSIRKVKLAPTPVFLMDVIQVDVNGRSAQRGPLTLGVANLLFDYGGHRIEPYNGEAHTRVADGDEVLEVERDLVRERRAEAAFESLSLVDAVTWGHDNHLRPNPFASNQYLLQPDPRKSPLPAESWTLVLNELVAGGFIIDFTRAFPRDDVVEIDDWIAEIEEVDDFGSPWFDISLGIDVDGQRIDLLPILRLLLADPDFPMRKPDDEPPDAAWRVRIDEARSVRLPLARLRAMLEPLLEWLMASEEGVRLHRTQAGVLHRISEATGMPWRGADKLQNHIDEWRELKIKVEPPEGFKAQLRPYQQEGLAWLTFLSDAGLGGVLADDMGLGKTVQVLAHLLLEKQRGRMEIPALVVAPTSLVGNWRDEAARFAPDLRVLVVHGSDRAARYDRIEQSDLVITTYPLLPRDRDILCAKRFSLLILDEAQAIKNARSLAAQVVREIPARRRLAMTGTPLENHLGELWAQFDAVEPGLLGGEGSFTRTYRTPIEKHGDMDRQQRLNRRVAMLLLRRRKEDVLTELPPKTEIVHSLDLVGSQRQLYETLRLAQHERVRESIAQRGLAQSGIVVIDALLKLRQACCDPRLVKLDSARKVNESAKLDALMELLEGLNDEGRRVLVFSQFTQMLALISKALDERKIRYLSLTGDTPASSRTELVRSFQEGEVPVFLISLKAGGVGLNLTAADTVIHYDPWWNPAVEAQATDRAHRMGQDKPVFVYKLICSGTVEEKIQAMQERKAELARAVLEGGGSTTSLRFDESDLAELFAPM